MKKRSKSNKYVLKGYEPYTKPKRKNAEPLVVKMRYSQIQFLVFDEWSDFK